MSKAAIGRKLGLHQATIRKLVTAVTVDDLIAKTEQRAHLVASGMKRNSRAC